MLRKITFLKKNQLFVVTTNDIQYAEDETNKLCSATNHLKMFI